MAGMKREFLHDSYDEIIVTYVVQTVLPDSTPTVDMPHSGYMLITSEHDWDGAGDYCRWLARGAHLVAMETVEEDQAIISHFEFPSKRRWVTQHEKSKES